MENTLPHTKLEDSRGLLLNHVVALVSSRKESNSHHPSLLSPGGQSSSLQGQNWKPELESPSNPSKKTCAQLEVV